MVTFLIHTLTPRFMDSGYGRLYFIWMLIQKCTLSWVHCTRLLGCRNLMALQLCLERLFDLSVRFSATAWWRLWWSSWVWTHSGSSLLVKWITWSEKNTVKNTIKINKAFCKCVDGGFVRSITCREVKNKTRINIHLNKDKALFFSIKKIA